MKKSMNRRAFAVATSGAFAATSLTLLNSANAATNDDDKEPEERKPVEADFTRDYDAPGFKPKWANKQINRTMVADFVIYAHSSLEMVEKLLEKQPALLNARVDWGNGDWEDALGAAAHMGRKDIAKSLLKRGARMDLFCATMMGQLEIVKAMLTLEPALIDAKGPHGFSLYHHARMGKDDSKQVLEYLNSVKPEKRKKK